MPTYASSVYNAVTSAIMTPIFPLTGSSGSMTVYSGVQPTAETVAANWANYNTANAICIGHAPGTWSWTPSPGNITLYATAGPTVAALNTGTATWAILWDSAVSNVQAGLNALPDEEFLVVPVGTTASNAIIRFGNVNFIPGQNFSPLNSGFTNITQ